jgi:hypothetical protein
MTVSTIDEHAALSRLILATSRRKPNILAGQGDPAPPADFLSMRL